jgi:thiamine-monophosphate kinase
MSTEKDIIKLISAQLPRCKKQLNELFESDSEIIQFNSSKLLFTVDSFSKEDYLSDESAYLLGWNLATATISDILATGGLPKFYAHSLSLNKNIWNQIYLEDLSRGIADVLKASKSFFIGGDLAFSDEWNYTGIAIGESKKPITRKGAKPGDIIMMTGQVGAGNLEACLKIYADNPKIDNSLKRYRTKLYLRYHESKLLNQFANSCTDTSDGLAIGLVNLAEINNVGFSLQKIPYLNNGLSTFKALYMPKELLFLGECGEYELLFTIDKRNLTEFNKCAEAKNLIFTPIGYITENPNRRFESSNYLFDLNDFTIRARNYEDVHQYIKDLTDYLLSHEKS